MCRQTHCQEFIVIISKFETVTDRGLNFTENYLGRGDLSVTSISGEICESPD